MLRELVTSPGDLPAVRVQVPLRGSAIGVPGDLLKHVQAHPGIGHPGESGMPEIVPPQVLVTELRDDLVPVGRIAQHTRSDPSATRTPKQSRARVVAADDVEALCDQLPNFFDQRHVPSPLPLVPLSAIPPGEGVVCQRTSHVHVLVSMSPTRQPDTSPMREAVHAAKITTSPQP